MMKEEEEEKGPIQKIMWMPPNNVCGVWTLGML
jgi:hypothetical protein